VAGAQKQAQIEGRTMVFVDESGFYLLPGLARTYAPCGQTPILCSVYTRAHVSVMSGLTMDGRLYTLVRDDALDSLDSVIFLKHLRPHVSEKLLVIWDGSPMHKGHVRTCLAAGGARQMHLEQLPPSAPDLNPGEGVWQHLKHVDMRHLCGVHLPHLRSELQLAIKRLRRKPHVLTACFAQAGLSVET
jgi:transposase